MDLLFGAAVGLLPALILLISTRRRGPSFAEPGGYLHPEPLATPGPGGRTCAAGGGAAEVWSAPASAASSATAVRCDGWASTPRLSVSSWSRQVRPEVGTSPLPTDVPAASTRPVMQ